MEKQKNKNPKSTTTNPFFLNSIIVLLTLIFCIGTFKNISYPLLWNDESETLVTAEKILEFGYPKVHDGKNIIYLPVDSTWIGYKKSNDSNVSMPWGTYYFATIGAALSHYTKDLYLKTALTRIPFAIMGVIGLIIFAASLSGFFSDKRTYQKFIIAFIIIELFSVILLLHLREARYYSLVIFTTSLFFHVVIQYFFHSNYSFKKYLLSMTLILFIAYQINVVCFSACCASLGIYEFVCRLYSYLSANEKNRSVWEEIKTLFKNTSPVLTSVILLAPFTILYDTFSTASRANSYAGMTTEQYFSAFNHIIDVIKMHEFFYPAFFVKCVQLIAWYITYKQNTKGAVQEYKMERLSLLMTIFFILFCLITAKLPVVLFTRYFIVLQPILVLIMLLDLVSILKYISSHMKSTVGTITKLAMLVILVRLVAINMGEKINYEKKYIYQITHQLKGPLDYIIPYIAENYKNTENLVLATNYEELSYIFYLNCKVTLGFMNKNLSEDLKYQPDVMVYRKKWGQNPEYFNQFIQKAKYKKISFPVFDSPVNNIAELNGAIEHQFKTRLAENDNDKMDILVREKD